MQNGSGQMKISACYITKNEAENLPRSINSIKSQVDEIIVADTGSTDDTVQIAKDLGAQVYHYEWHDDFAAARNFALEKATGDWLVILDADEYFTDETAHNLREVIKMAGNAGGLMIKLVNYDVDLKSVLDYLYHLRVVRRVPGLRYQGIIHEELKVGDGEIPHLAKVPPDLLEIYHTGYRDSINTDKAKRNLALLQRAMEMGEPAEKLARYLCETYFKLNETEKMLYYGWMYVQQPRPPINYASHCHRLLMGHYGYGEGWDNECQRMKLAALSVRDYPEVPDFWAEYGECLYWWKRYQEAADASDKALELLEDYQGLEPSMLKIDKMDGTVAERGKLFAELAEQAAKVKITACLIVKNEEKNIPHWLANVREFADEIIVVDTGSVDGTKEFLAAEGVAYHEYPWANDFAAAKNFAIEQAHGDWIVFLDADETFIYPKSVRGYLSDLQDREDVQVISIPLHNVDADNNRELLNIAAVIRIFRRRGNLRYRGAVHEQIFDASKPKENIFYSQTGDMLAIEHTGYSTSIVQGKIRRNIALMEQEIAAHGNIERYYKDLAVSYFGLGEYQQALDYALLATQSPYQPLGQQGDIYWTALESMEELGYAHEDKMAVVEAALAVAGNVPDFWGYKGYFLCQAGKFAEGRKFLAKAFAMQEKQEKQGVFLHVTHFSQLTSQFKTALAECYWQLGDAPSARRCYEEVLSSSKWYADALAGYADTYPMLEDAGLKAKLLGLYNTSPREWRRMQKLLWLHGHGENTRPQGQLLLAMSYNVQYLTVALLGRELDLASPMIKGQLGLLPEGLKNLVLSFHGRKCSDKGFSCDDYKKIFKQVMTFGSAEMLTRYVALAAEFSDGERKELAQALADKEKYVLALSLLQDIGMDSPAVDSGFWLLCGKIFYGLGEYASAEECLAQVEADEDNSLELASYLTWCKEADAK